jgi:hypothetical protein
MRRHDVSIALAHEINPFLQNNHEFEFHDPVTVPFRVGHNTPFVSGLVPFVECAESLNMHPATASILDDMRFLINAVLSLPEEPSPQELQKVKSTAVWIHERISNLPLTPASRRSSPADGNAAGGNSSKRGSVASATSGPRRASTVSAAGDNKQGVVAQASGTPQIGEQRSPLGTGRSPGASDAAAQTSTPGTPSLTPSPMPEAPDYMYQIVRMTAIVYARAVRDRVAISKACTPNEFLQIWTSTWRVPLSSWKAVNGVFMWVMLSIVSSCHETPHERFVKSMLVLAIQTLAMDNWHVALDAMRAGMSLELWLRGEVTKVKREKGTEGDGPVSGGESVARHGYHQPEHWRG